MRRFGLREFLLASVDAHCFGEQRFVCVVGVDGADIVALRAGESRLGGRNVEQRSDLLFAASDGGIVACLAGFHGVNVKLVKTGGVSAAYDALSAARAAGLKTMIGCMIESSVLISAAAHLAELADYLDLDGNLLIANDSYAGVTAEQGVLSFAGATEPTGLRVVKRAG